MKRAHRLLPWLVAGWLCLTGTGLAANASADASVFDAPILPGDARTPAALARKVFPGLDETGADGPVTAREQVLRQPGTKERFTLPAGARLTGATPLAVRGDGRSHLLVLWQFEADTDTPGGGAAVLSVFPEGDLAPTDVVSVQTDAFCDLGDGKLLPLGPDEAFFLRNHHFNSDQSYLDTGLYHVVSGRLRRIAQVFTLSVRGGCDTAFDERLDWRTQARPGAALPDVTATVRLAPGEGCRKGPLGAAAREFRETYRHDAHLGRYVARGDGFAALDAFNAKRF